MKLASGRRRICASSYQIYSITVALSLCVGLSLLGGCGNANPYFDPSKPHHRPTGFANNYAQEPPKGFFSVLGWRLGSWAKGLPKLPQTATPQLVPDLGVIEANGQAGARMQPAVTWIGHASMLVQMGGLTLLTAPIFSERASPVSWAGPKRLYPPALSLAQLPRIDVVLISHNHLDHLDLNSVLALANQAGGAPLFIVPLGIKPWLAAQGIDNAVELDWWDAHQVGGVEFILTPVQHWSARSLWDRQETLWGGFAVLANDFHLFFSDDTGYSQDFADIAARLAPRQAGKGFDLALLPIGCYEPRWFMAQQHVNPAQAVQIHKDLRAQRSIGLHWGTFHGMCDEPLDQAPQDLAAARQAQGLGEADFSVMALGETRRFAKRSGL
jgi:N-acyl-phosphatidylethanolamine-hydrolysing phospholipase D